MLNLIFSYRAAGINTRLKYGTRRNRVINYNGEIPFEKRPAIGFYDTANEKADFSKTDFKRLRMDQVDEKRRDEEEGKERKKDKKILKQRKENDIPAELMNNEEPARKRSKLVLPSPQISDSELEQIVKLGKASEAARDGVVDGESVRASDTLLQDYTVTPSSAMRTPRTPMAAQDKILQEAQNIMALQNTDTPLKGGMNTPLHNEGGDFSGQLTGTTTRPVMMSLPGGQAAGVKTVSVRGGGVAAGQQILTLPGGGQQTQTMMIGGKPVTVLTSGAQQLGGKTVQLVSQGGGGQPMVVMQGGQRQPAEATTPVTSNAALVTDNDMESDDAREQAMNLFERKIDMLIESSQSIQ